MANCIHRMQCCQTVIAESNYGKLISPNSMMAKCNRQIHWWEIVIAESNYGKLYSLNPMMLNCNRRIQLLQVDIVIAESNYGKFYSLNPMMANCNRRIQLWQVDIAKSIAVNWKVSDMKKIKNQLQFIKKLSLFHKLLSLYLCNPMS